MDNWKEMLVDGFPAVNLQTNGVEMILELVN